MSKRAGNKDIRAALPPGFSIVSRGKHHAVVGPDGKVVRSESGRPVVVPKGQKIAQPSLTRLLEMLERKCRDEQGS